MTKVFSRLYAQLFFAAVVAIGILALAAFLLAQYRFLHYAESQIKPVIQLADSQLNRLADADKPAFFELLSILTNTEWQPESSSEAITTDVEITSVNLSGNVAEVKTFLNKQFETSLRIDEWQDWQIGLGWLVLNELSETPVDSRQQRAEQLNEQLPWPLTRMPLSGQPLSTFDLQQLKDGQAVRNLGKEHNSDFLYYPAGASQVIRFGPVPHFQLLTPGQWVGLVLVGLGIAGLTLAYLLVPLQRRIAEVQRGVDSIALDQKDIQLPTGYMDDLGTMSRHIEQMARHLIREVENNRMLNMAVSHDLKTPLARMKFALALYENSGDKTLLSELDTEIDLLTELTNELLNFHLISATPPENIEPLNLSEALADYVSYTQGQEGNACQIQLDIAADDLTFPIAAEHWQRIIHNLITNACQYGNNQISVSLYKAADSVCLRVADNGPGMSKTEFEELKQPFRRGDSSRNLDAKNHGLGLAMIDAICDRYSAEFSAEPAGENPAYLCITFPTIS